jgi:hypothetical protein
MTILWNCAEDRTFTRPLALADADKREADQISVSFLAASFLSADAVGED